MALTSSSCRHTVVTTVLMTPIMTAESAQLTIKTTTSESYPANLRPQLQTSSVLDNALNPLIKGQTPISIDFSHSGEMLCKAVLVYLH